MIFEFVIVYQWEKAFPIHDVLVERISRVLTDNLNEFDADAVEQMVQVKYERRTHPSNAEVPQNVIRSVMGFTLDLPEETASPRIVIDEFVDALNAEPIEHVVKFEDPLLHQELRQLAEEIFIIEMKLRRVLTIIYLHAYRGDLPYNLLREETMKPMDDVNEKDMQNVCENEFFHLTFKQYINLNRRPEIKQIQALVDLIRSIPDYKALQTEVERLPVGDEDDAVFLAGLKERMNTIDIMRNCVAHNRRPSRHLTNQYLNVRPLLEKALDDFLSRWALETDLYEDPWDEAARQAVEQLMESSEWDDEAKTITLVDNDNPQSSKIASTRGELEYYLGAYAREAFYANAPREDGEILYEPDEDTIVEAVLSTYEDRLTEFFPND
jgi:hypothetical protein